MRDEIVGAPSGLATAASSTATVVAAAPGSTPTASGSGDTCPDCGARRAGPDAKFCEVCRYNFVTRQSWSAPRVDTSPPPAPAPPEPAPAMVSAAVAAPPPVSMPQPRLQLAPVSAPPPIDGPPPVDAPPAVDVAAVPEGAPQLSLARWEAVVVVDPSLYVDPDPT